VGFLAAFGGSDVAVAWATAVVSSVFGVIISVSPLAVITVTTSITPVAPESKANLQAAVAGDGVAMPRRLGADAKDAVAPVGTAKRALLNPRGRCEDSNCIR